MHMSGISAYLFVSLYAYVGSLYLHVRPSMHKALLACLLVSLYIYVYGLPVCLSVCMYET